MPFRAMAPLSMCLRPKGTQRWPKNAVDVWVDAAGSGAAGRACALSKALYCLTALHCRRSANVPEHYRQGTCARNDVVG